MHATGSICLPFTPFIPPSKTEYQEPPVLPLTHARTFFRIGAQLYDNLLQMRATMVRGGGDRGLVSPTHLDVLLKGQVASMFPQTFSSL